MSEYERTSKKTIIRWLEDERAKVRGLEEEVAKLRQMGKAMCYLPEGSLAFEGAVNDFEDYYNNLKEAGE